MGVVIQFPLTRERHNQIEAVKDIIRDLETKLDHRPLVGGIELRRMGCSMGCTRGYLECAIIPRSIDQWETEFARLGGCWSPKQDEGGLS